MATITKSAATRLADRYLRCDDFAARIDGVELSPDVWAVFAQLAESRTAPEIARLLTLDVEAVNAAIRRLVRRKLVRKHVVAWRDYAAQSVAGAPAGQQATLATPKPPTPTNQPSSASSASVSHPSTLNSQLPSSLSAPPFYVTSATAASVSHPSTLNSQLSSAPSPRSPIISLRITSPSASPRPSPAVSLRIEPVRPATPQQSTIPAAPAANIATSDGLRLRPVLDAIGARAGGGVAGQLLVYRVFLQIPTELMQAAGLHSLSLVDDRFTLRHPELRAALAETARRHAGVDIEALAAAV